MPTLPNKDSNEELGQLIHEAQDSKHIDATDVPVPATPCRYKDSVRISFHPRCEMRSCPVVVLHCEGVLGDFEPMLFWARKPPLFKFRGKLRTGLTHLRTKFQVLLVTKMSAEQLSVALHKLKSKGCHFDAAYCYRQTASRYSYSQIVRDFGLPDARSQARKLLASLFSLCSD